MGEEEIMEEVDVGEDAGMKMQEARIRQKLSVIVATNMDIISMSAQN